ncbi:hypothetical protein QE381_001676 [Microbacterium sp. SORGH_AS 888]|nr:hypothetical protein [Microbacterium sp. SORGH_AS_0888]
MTTRRSFLLVAIASATLSIALGNASYAAPTTSEVNPEHVGLIPFNAPIPEGLDRAEPIAMESGI